MSAVETIIIILPVWLSFNLIERFWVGVEYIRCRAAVLGELLNAAAGVSLLGFVLFILLG